MEVVADSEANSCVTHTRIQQDVVVVGVYAVRGIVSILPILDGSNDLPIALLVLDVPYCQVVCGAPSARFSYESPPLLYIFHFDCLEGVAADDFGDELFPALWVVGSYVSYDFEVSPRLKGDIDELKQVFQQYRHVLWFASYRRSLVGVSIVLFHGFSGWVKARLSEHFREEVQTAR